MNKEKKLIPGLPSGFEDRWDKKLLLKKKLLKAIENNFIKFGAEALETPSFEISENIGSFLAEDDANPMSDVFSFQDGEKSITLRYDLSSPLARFVAQNNQELPSIFKRYAIQNVFRNEKAGNGRYREFMQADFDIVGNVNPAQANAELCNLISSTLLDCGLKKDQFTINVSNRKIVQGLIDDLKISEEKQVKVIRAIDKLDKPGFGLKGVEDLLKKERKDISGAITKGADLNDEQASEILNFLKIKDLKELKETLKNPLSQEGIKELEQVFEVLGYSSNLNQVKTNFTIVRGLAYYSDFIVETNLNFKVTKVDRLLFALMQLDQIKVDSQKPVLVCVMDEKYLKNYYEILDLLRNNNINAEIFLDTKKNLGKQLTLANKRELDVAIICGENEFNENTKENLIDEVKKLIWKHP